MNNKNMNNNNNVPKVSDDDDVAVVVEHLQYNSRPKKSGKEFKENNADEINKNSYLSQIKSMEPKSKKLEENIPPNHVQNNNNKNAEDSSRVQSKGQKSKKVKTNHFAHWTSCLLYFGFQVLNV